MDLILVAHGSRSHEANEAHLRLVDTVSAELDRPVLPAFLELAEPSIVDVIAAAADRGGPIVVLPYFIHPGRHVREHLPEIVEAARGRNPGVDIRLAAPFGDDPALAGIVAAQLRAAAEGPTGT